MIIALKIILALIGAVIIWLGLNVSLGGIATLGWQGPKDFFTISNEAAFAVQDNHVRFIGGVWLGVGAFFIAGAVWLEQLSTVLKALIVMVFIGGIARLSVADPDLLLSAKIAPSLIAELVLFPAIGLWIHKTAKRNH